MRYRVVHSIEIAFEEEVARAELDLLLTPKSEGRQTILFHQLLVDPTPTNADGPRVVLDGPFKTLAISSVTTVEFAPVASRGREALDAIAELLERVRTPEPKTPPNGKGHCRALSEALLEKLARDGVRAAYVAGYRLSASDKRTLPHAWVSIELPGSSDGAFEFDPSFGEVIGEDADVHHLVLARGAGYADTQPLRGSLAAIGAYRLSSTVEVEALLAPPPRGVR